MDAFIRMPAEDKAQTFKEAEWRRDYEAMRGEMFSRTPPSFDAVLKAASEFEKEFNRK